jgi:hypothetical protein
MKNGCFCLLRVQFSFNFVVYAARSEQYRRAYADLLRRLFCCLQARRSDWDAQQRSHPGSRSRHNRTIVVIVDGEGHLRRRRFHHHHHHAQNSRVGYKIRRLYSFMQ